MSNVSVRGRGVQREGAGDHGARRSRQEGEAAFPPCRGARRRRAPRRLVLGCMDSYDSEQRRILQHFSQSTRFASFCTAAISEILQICIKISLIFAEISQKPSEIFQKSENIQKAIYVFPENTGAPPCSRAFLNVFGFF